jgi:FSR family fosmidomycin resistance protein-like MFS transporter
VTTETAPDTPAPLTETAPVQTALSILLYLSLSHLLNDTLQSLIPAIYPVLKERYALSFTNIGLITLTYQCTASLLQPIVGTVADKRPAPWLLPLAMALTLLGLLAFAFAGSFPVLLLSAALVGMGSSLFHPEASRVAHLAAGRRHGFAQSLFQLGGNFGTSLGPLLAAAIIVPLGQRALAFFTVLAFTGIVVLYRVAAWYRGHLAERRRQSARAGPALPGGTVALSISILIVLIISKYVYLVSLTNYYTFYLIQKFNVGVQASQIYLFLFLFAVAAGTIAGGPLGDRFGRKIVIWVSILGVAPFTLLLPYVSLPLVIVLSLIIGMVLASAFSAILVYAQELIPGKVGMIAGLFFGFAFGISGIAAAGLGTLADHTSLEFVFRLCGYLPLLGLLAAFLPNLRRGGK